MHKRNVLFAALLAAGLACGSAQAATVIGSATGAQATIEDSGNFDSSAAVGLAYKGVEFVNIDVRSSWYTLVTGAGTSTAQYGSNPLGATTLFGSSSVALVGAVGGLSFFETVTVPTANQIAVQVQLTNIGPDAIRGVLWGVGFDPDPSGSGFNTTNNKIVGVGNNAAVSATALSGWPNAGYSVTLANTTSASAHAIAAYINGGDCCSAVAPSVALAASQALGHSTVGDDSISLAYDLGTIAAGQTVTIGYSYTFAVPEPDTYAMLLAGLFMVGFIARRRMQNFA